MYSPSEIQPFDTTTATATMPTTLSSELSVNYDYMRRFSYAELLSNQSEASLSDYEQQTPSPSNDYEDYIYHQQQHQPHPLDDKRRMSTAPLVDLNTYPLMAHQPVDYQWLQPALPFGRPVSPMYDPSQQSFLQTMPNMFEGYHPLSPCNMAMMDVTASTAVPMSALTSPDASSDLDDAAFRERSSSASSASSTESSGGKVKQTRSRGRRVSSNPSAVGQKMFTCNHDDCGKVFKRSEHLKRHIRSIHTLEKPFECPYQSCSKRFSRSDNLNQHIRIHRHTSKDKNAPHSASRSSSFSNYMPSYATCNSS